MDEEINVIERLLESHAETLFEVHLSLLEDDFEELKKSILLMIQKNEASSPVSIELEKVINMKEKFGQTLKMLNMMLVLLKLKKYDL